MTNPLLSESTLPYGLPPFEGLSAADYREAILTGLAEHREEIAAILAQEQAPSFANTVLEFERSGRLLDRAAGAFFTVISADTNDQLKAVEAEVVPLFTAHMDAIFLDARFYARFTALDASGLEGEDLQLLNETLKKFRLAGVELGSEQMERLKRINNELSVLGTEFSQKTTQGMNDAALLVDTPEQLRGLDQEAIRAAAQAASEAGKEGKYLIPLILPTSQPALSVLEDPQTRATLLNNSLSRGVVPGGTDVRENILQQVRLRAEKAELLGFGNYAELKVEDQTAPGLAPVRELLARMAPAARRNAEAEAAALSESAGGPISAADWQFFSDRVRSERYAIDEQALRPYFELDSVLNNGVFYAAERLFGLSFTPRPDIKAYHPEVRVWEVKDENGNGIGLFLGDFFTRPSKRGGAWMNLAVNQSDFLGTKPVVFNTSNVAHPAKGEPALLTLDELRTLFHEFGHALHGLLSEVRYDSLSGTNVARDFVEYPSQVNEMWIFHPEVLNNYARHYQSGEVLPAETVAQLEAAQLWGQGFATTEYLGAALLDLAWHSFSSAEVPADVESFEAQALASVGLNWELLPPRYRSGYFQHIFAGDGYAAGYYSYIWSETLDADTVEWFRENGGLNRANGEHFRAELLSRGNSRDPLESFRKFRGRDAEVAPLLARRGLD